MARATPEPKKNNGLVVRGGMGSRRGSQDVGQGQGPNTEYPRRNARLDAVPSQRSKNGPHSDISDSSLGFVATARLLIQAGSKRFRQAISRFEYEEINQRVRSVGIYDDDRGGEEESDSFLGIGGPIQAGSLGTGRVAQRVISTSPERSIKMLSSCPRVNPKSSKPISASGIRNCSPMIRAME